MDKETTVRQSIQFFEAELAFAEGRLNQAESSGDRSLTHRYKGEIFAWTCAIAYLRGVISALEKKESDECPDCGYLECRCIEPPWETEEPQRKRFPEGTT